MSARQKPRKALRCHSRNYLGIFLFSLFHQSLPTNHPRSFDPSETTRQERQGRYPAHRILQPCMRTGHGLRDVSMYSSNPTKSHLPYCPEPSGFPLESWPSPSPKATYDAGIKPLPPFWSATLIQPLPSLNMSVSFYNEGDMLEELTLLLICVRMILPPHSTRIWMLPWSQNWLQRLGVVLLRWIRALRKVIQS